MGGFNFEKYHVITKQDHVQTLISHELAFKLALLSHDNHGIKSKNIQLFLPSPSSFHWLDHGGYSSFHWLDHGGYSSFHWLDHGGYSLFHWLDHGGYSLFHWLDHGGYSLPRTIPLSSSRVVMMMTEHFCSQTILQKSATVQ